MNELFGENAHEKIYAEPQSNKADLLLKVRFYNSTITSSFPEYIVVIIPGILSLSTVERAKAASKSTEYRIRSKQIQNVKYFSKND